MQVPLGAKGGTPRGSSAPLRAGSGSAMKEAFPELSSCLSEALFHPASGLQVAEQRSKQARRPLTHAPRQRH